MFGSFIKLIDYIGVRSLSKIRNIPYKTFQDFFLNLQATIEKSEESQQDKESSLATTPVTTESKIENFNEVVNDEESSSIIESTTLSTSEKQKQMLSGLPIKQPLDYLSDLVECHIAVRILSFIVCWVYTYFCIQIKSIRVNKGINFFLCIFLVTSNIKEL